MRVAILGAGGLARELRCLFSEDPAAFEFAGYVTSDPSRAGEHDSKDEVIGSIDDLIAGRLAVDGVCCGIGTPSVRKKLFDDITTRAPSLEWPAIVSRRAVLMDREKTTLGRGAVVTPGCVLTTNITIEDNAFINLCTTIGHESTIGAHSVLNPTVNISGGVVLRDCVLVGTGAQVLQYLEVGQGATVGAASCVTKSVAEQTVVVGIPAKPRG